jgi:hypothetical protein
MDCQQWAEGVIAALHQGSSKQPSFPEFLLPKPTIAGPTNQRLKQRSRSNGSTFLEAPAAPRGASQDAKHWDVIAAFPSLTPSQASEVTSDIDSSKYKRRLRKKPRADLYERAAPKPIQRTVRGKADKFRTAKHNNRSYAAVHLRPAVPVAYPDRLTVGVMQHRENSTY